MRHLRFAILAVVLSLGGCAALDPAGKSIFAGGTSLTASITSPIGPVDIYRVKTVYASALEIAVGYREYCWSKPYAVLMADPIAKPVCQSRRRNVRAMQAADIRADAAISTAENFIRNNPTVSAASAVSAAWAAVTDFQGAVNRTAVAIAAAK